MNRHYRIKDFVQKNLGCTCPDKVFEEIEDLPVAPLSAPHTRRIAIGGRLLIYIWNVKGTYKFKENLLAMLAAGKRERDARGFNRFRAVLAVDDTPQHVAKKAQLYFSHYADRDDRMHIHVVAIAALKDL